MRLFLRMERRRRRLSRLSVRKHFRKSLMHDIAQRTVPNKSLSIICISSDSECSDSEEVPDLSNHNTGNKDEEDTDCSIISPSPNKNDNLRCLSTGKRKVLSTLHFNRNNSGHITDNDQKKQETKIFPEISILNYDHFKTPLSTPSSLVNSTMVHVVETNASSENKDSRENSELDALSESVNKSFEKLLDNIYGDSWRPFKEKVLPSSERKPPKKKSSRQQMPVTERKPKRTEGNENFKSKGLLIALQKNKLEEMKNSQLNDLHSTPEVVRRGKGHSPIKIRTKLNFDEDSDDCNIKEQQSSNLLDNKNKTCWSDEDLPLEERLRKNLSNKKNFKTVNVNGKLLKNLGATEFNKVIMKTSPSLTSKPTINTNNIDKDCTSHESSSDDIRFVSVGKKKKLRKFLDSTHSNSTSDEDNDSDNSMKIEKKSNKTDFEDIGELSDAFCTDRDSKKGPEDTKKGIKLQASDNFNKDIDEVGKGVRKPVSKKQLKSSNKKYCSESSSECDDIVQALGELDLKKSDQTKTYSFLASLSSNVPDQRCNPEAKQYRANFKKTKEELVRRLFSLYNKQVFDNRLPKDFQVDWNARLTCTAGYCRTKRITHRDGTIDYEARIELSTKVLTTPERLRCTLIHELCHAATWLIDKAEDGHGNLWKAWTIKARKAFPELPPIRVSHSYEINYKFLYKCSDCGYSIQRNRKSLDLERIRCGYCRGKFVLFLNKVNKKGEQKLVPADTPKKEPKGFALFVQENSSKYSNMNCAERMRQLSKDYKALKVQ